MTPLFSSICKLRKSSGRRSRRSFYAERAIVCPPALPQAWRTRSFPERKALPQQGVTLLELLIAMVILAALASALTVSVRSLRSRAAGVNCVNNLRQIGAANIRYAAEHRGKIAARNNSRDAAGNTTPRTEWYRYIWRTHFGATNGDGTASGDTGYCSQMICPADPTRGGELTASRSLQRSYNVNQRLTSSQRARTMQEVSDLSKTMYAGDIDWIAAGNSEYIIGTNARNLDAIPRDRHAGNAHFVFLDGHVETISIPNIYPGKSRSAIFELVQP